MQARPLRAFANNVYVNLSSGLVLFGTSLTEVVQTIEEGAIGAAHGVAIFGILHVMKVIPELLEGSEFLARTRK